MQLEELEAPLQLGPEISRGSYGSVFQDLVEPKYVIKTNIVGTKAQSLKREVENMILIEYRLGANHPILKNLALYKYAASYQATPDTRYVYILMDKYDTDLEKYLKDKNNRFNLYLIDKIRKTIGAILSAFKEKGIIHKDIKPANILLNIDTNNIIKKVALADFGSVAILSEHNYNNDNYAEEVEDYEGSIFYMSPMAISNIESYKNDRWSLACILLNMITLYTIDSKKEREYFNIVRPKDITAAVRSILRIPIDISEDENFTSERIITALLDENNSTKPCDDFVDCVKKGTNKLDGEKMNPSIRMDRDAAYYKTFRNRIKNHLDFILNIFKSFYEFSLHQENKLSTMGGKIEKKIKVI